MKAWAYTKDGKVVSSVRFNTPDHYTDSTWYATGHDIIELVINDEELEAKIEERVRLQTAIAELYKTRLHQATDEIQHLKQQHEADLREIVEIAIGTWPHSLTEEAISKYTTDCLEEFERRREGT